MKARASVLAALLAAAFSCQAYVVDYDAGGRIRRWDLVTPEVHVGPAARIPVSTNVVNPKTRAVRFFIAADAYSTTNTVAELNAVRAAFAQWQSAPGTILKFEDAGLVPAGVDIDEGDHTNVVFWAKKSTLVAGGTADISNALGVTFFDSLDNVLVGVDIVLNGESLLGYRWFTDINYRPADARYQFIEGVLLHEVGHLIGLEHAPLGAATMFFRGGVGVNTMTGLAGDDVAGCQFLYPQTTFLATLGRLQGRVTINSSNTFGAVVVAENTATGTAVATLTRADGTYELAALPPGNYLVRAAPMDAPGSFNYLCRGQDISPDYNLAETRFLPSTNSTVSVQANTARTLNLALAGAEPAFRVSHIRKATTDPASQIRLNAATAATVGQSNVIVGVYGPNLPLTGATLTITGEGLSIRPVESTSGFFGLNLISAAVDISPNAPPGLRSFAVQQGANVAYANGFFEIQPAWPDFNFDGLDDLFQRQFFPLFTAPEAGPSADPDRDGFSNRYEYLTASNPADRFSLPVIRLERIIWTLQGATLEWKAVSGARYQVFARDALAPAQNWTAISPVITASTSLAQFTDVGASAETRFYRVLALPDY